MSAFHSPTIRSLHQNGLSFLLFNNEERRNVFFPSKLEGGNFIAVPSNKGNMPSQFSSQNKTHVQMTNASPPYSMATKSNNDQTQPNPTQAIPSGIASNNTHDNAPINLVDTANKQPLPSEQIKKNETLAIEHWPNEWLNVHKRFGLPTEENRNSQIRVVWTYAGLEQDAFGPINKKRQDIIKELAIELNHKKGTHSFIPYSFVHEDGSSQLEIHQNKSFFWSAMRLVQPRILLIFGSTARDTLNMPKALTPLQKVDMGTLQVLQMHKPETLADERDHYTKTVAFLHEYLKFCPKKIQNINITD